MPRKQLRSGLQAYVMNLAYALNVVDWLAQDEALAQVRNKGMQSRPLEQVKEGTVGLIKAANIVGLPLFLHPRNDVVLSDRYTAGSYLEERLRELGVKG